MLCGWSSTKNTNQYIDDAKVIHSDKYIYEHCKYVKSYINVSIKCIFYGPLSALTIIDQLLGSLTPNFYLLIINYIM